MKKMLMLAGILLSVKGFSQIFSVGPVVGMQHTYLTSMNGKFNPNWNAGMNITYSTLQNWGVGADVRYSHEGVIYNNTDLRSELKLEYLRVPLRIIYFFNEYGDAVRPKATIGPSMGFLMNTNDHPGLNTFDIGVNGSLGCNFRLERDIWLNTDLIYNRGIKKVHPNAVMGDRNGGIGLSAGITFGF